MKPLSEQDHYEILEIPRETSQREIERAYQLAQATYADDSLAGYSVFAEGDAEAMRERIETAYRVLSDEESRRAYDGSLAAGVAPPRSCRPGWPSAKLRQPARNRWSRSRPSRLSTSSMTTPVTMTALACDVRACAGGWRSKMSRV